LLYILVLEGPTMTFAERLKELRSKAGLSREQLAEGSGLARGTVRDYEQGKRKPTLESAVKLASALGTDCRAFADCVEGKPVPKKTTRKKA
jgi:transcriptional regulator with XRE-family HTH domain